MSNMTELLKYGMKYGPVTVGFFFLLWLLAIKFDAKLDKGLELQAEVVAIMRDIRDGRVRYSFTPPTPSAASFSIRPQSID